MRCHAAAALRWPDFIAAAWAVIWQRGDTRTRFKQAFARSLGVESGAISLFGSGRAALHAFVDSLRLGRDDEVLLPGYTCAVVPNVFMHLGLTVRYVDVAAAGVNPAAEAVAAAIGPRTRVVVLPHNFGITMSGIAALRERFAQVVFIEDAAHAWGSRDARGMPAGTRAQAAFFSFEFSKCLSTGQGGALLVNDATLCQRCAAALGPLEPPSAGSVARQLLTLAWHRLCGAWPGWALRALGPVLRAGARAFGLVAKTPASQLSGDSLPHYRQALSDFGAAIGARQLARATSLWAQRRAQARRYDELLVGQSRMQPLSRAPGDVLLRYPVRVAPRDREAVLQGLIALDIEPGLWFDDVVHPRGSLRYGYADGQCPHGEALAQSILNLPLGLHADLSHAQALGLRALAQAAST